MPKTKTCSGCGQRKPLTEYYRNRRAPDGLYWNCKRCCAKVRRRYYLKSRKRILAYQRNYDAAHRQERQTYRDTHKELSRAYYRRNRERILERAHRYREAKLQAECPVGVRMPVRIQLSRRRGQDVPPAQSMSADHHAGEIHSKSAGMALGRKW
jgi:hypothetical protein